MSTAMVRNIGGALVVGVLVIGGCGDDRPPQPPGAGATGGAEAGMGGETGGKGGRGGSGELPAGMGGESGGSASGGAGNEAGAENGGSLQDGGRGGGGGSAGISGEAGSGAEAGIGGEAGNGGEAGTTGTAGSTSSAGDGGAGGSSGAGGSGDSGSGAGGSGGAAGSSGGASGGSAGTSGGSTGGAAAGGTAGTGDPGPDCETGDEEICQITPGNRGGCFQSIRVCDGGTWGTCQAIPGEQTPGGEACNGEDEDCDGEIDEDLGEFSCGLGACRNTVAACTKGTLGVCRPLEPQTATDGCNDIDDDCDGAVDEDCRDCVHVAPDGNDAAALADDGATPFRNVQPAIDFAAASGTPRVCVAAGAACGAAATFPGPAASDLTMQDGVSVQANYESTGWTRCSNSTTTLAPVTARGVYFPPSIANPTGLDGFTVERAATQTTAGVTVEGARAVMLSNLRILNSVAGGFSYGVNVTNGAQATIVRSRIEGGTATQESIGVRSVGARVQLEDNCEAFDPATGRCAGACTIAGRGAVSNHGAVNLGVSLDDAPGSRIERSHVCAEYASEYATAAAVRIQGDSARVVVRASALTIPPTSRHIAYGFGMEMTECGGAAPWLVDNNVEATPYSTLEVRGVSSSGACHPTVDSNQIIAGSTAMSWPTPGTVVHCGEAAGIASGCVLAGNQISSRGSADNALLQWGMIGINCSKGGCAKISRNKVVGRTHSSRDLCQGNCNAEITALSIQSGGPFVDRNEFSLGCASAGTTVSMSRAWARFQNNFVYGKVCQSGVFVRFHSERLLDVNAAQEGLEINSNNFQGGGAATCPVLSQDVVVWQGGSKAGVFRNNYTGLGRCSGIPVAEADAASEPAVLENNALGSAFDLYLNEGVTTISPIADVNAMTDIICSGNVRGGPRADLGTPAGAPLWDFYGNPRDDTPSIGATEL